MTELKKCVYCNHLVGITNGADYSTHLSECPQNPENLPCRKNKQVACENLNIGVRLKSDGTVVLRTWCRKQGCFKSLETTVFSSWEPGVPVSEPLLNSS